MASNFFYRLLLLVTAGSAWTMDYPTAPEELPAIQEELPIINEAASYKVFFEGGHVIEHSREDMNFVYLAASNTADDSNVLYYDKKGKLLESQYCNLGNIRGFGCSDSESLFDKDCAINTYRSSSICQAIEKRLDSGTKPAVINFVALTKENGSKLITFYRDIYCENNVAFFKLDFSDLSPDIIDEHINSWKYFMDIDKEIEKEIKECLNCKELDGYYDNRQESENENDCIIS